MWQTDVMLEAAKARVIAAVTFHYLPGRLRYLADVLISISSFPVEDLKINIFTNSDNADEILKIEDIAKILSASVEIISITDLQHPYHLAWAHKPLIQDWCLSRSDSYTHFIYVEDDERITYENFLYFLFARRELKGYGLIPGFMRYEWGSKSAALFNLDSLKKIELTGRPYIQGRKTRYITIDAPYCGCFILDLQLAREYIETKSFDRTSSEFIPWEVRERSAAGLTWENIPESFVSRVAIPISKNERGSPSMCWLAHLPSNYADDPNVPHGKVLMADLFQGALSTEFLRAAPNGESEEGVGHASPRESGRGWFRFLARR